MSATHKSTPAADGFRMPGEFEPHSGCWMAWPERTDNWRLGAKPAQEAFAAVATAIAASEPVTMAVSDARFENCRAMLPPEVRVVEVSTDDAWMRDTGPTFVVDGDGGRRGVDWRFNAWGGTDGGLYFPWDRDDRVAAKVLEVEGDDRYRAPIVLEGGAIHVDGEGTVLTHRRVPAQPEPQPGALARSRSSGCCSTISAPRRWSGSAPASSKTRPTATSTTSPASPARGTVLLTWTDDEDDPSTRSRATRASGWKPQPTPGALAGGRAPPLPRAAADLSRGGQGVDAGEGTQPRRAGDRLAASYVNFYLGNSRIVYPLLDPRHDEEAAAILRRVFPEREVVGVPAREILLGGGNIHCITQQVPRG